jgi:2',3'-cyclic-nucleotide 2'-phosphodiesterase/3'-nucleotidase
VAASIPSIPPRTEPQELINTGLCRLQLRHRDLAELSYEIDVTQPPGSASAICSCAASRSIPGQEFLVATNNYRASGGGNFPGLDGSKTVLASPDASRDVLIAYDPRRSKAA